MKRARVGILLASSICLFSMLGCTHSKSVTSGSLSTSSTSTTPPTSSLPSKPSIESVTSSSTASLQITDETELAKAFSMAPSTSLHHPAYGTTERKAILDAMRPAIERAIGLKVIFEVNAINVEGGFAFINGIPRLPSGAKIDYCKTKLHPIFEDGLLDGGYDAPVYALLRYRAGHWELITYVIGPTDVAYASWWQEYGAPKSIFPYVE